MKIKMTVYSEYGTTEEVTGEDIGLEVHGKRFVVHKTPTFGWFITDLPPECKWTVTETSTGFCVCKDATKKKAIERAKARLAKISAKQIKTACAKAKKILGKVLSERMAREAD